MNVCPYDVSDLWLHHLTHTHALSAFVARVLPAAPAGFVRGLFVRDGVGVCADFSRFLARYACRTGLTATCDRYRVLFPYPAPSYPCAPFRTVICSCTCV
jgi:hypothetical protein